MLDDLIAVKRRQIPRDLRLLPEHNADIRHIFLALLVGNVACYGHAAAVGIENT